MIALCLTHAGHADADAYEKDYLHSLKQMREGEVEEVKGRLAWMRRKLVALVGGNWYYETPVILRVGSTDAIWFGRDSAGYLLLNLRMPTLSGEPRVVISENFFTVGRDHVVDVECSARGKIIRISYPNADEFAMRYRDIFDEDDLRARYGEQVGTHVVSDFVDFPVTVVEVSERTRNSELEFGPTFTRLGGVTLNRSWFIGGPGINLSVNPLEESLYFPDGSAGGR